LSGLGTAEWKDLDRLCLKALRTDYRERYASVEALGRDVDHYLKKEPLEAAPAQLGYRLSKFVSRNRRAVVAAAVIFALFCGMAIFFTLRLAKERNEAVLEAARTKRIQRFMLGLFGDDERAAGPSKDMKVVTLLDAGAKKVGALRADPESQGQMYETLSEMYRRLGDPGKAGKYQELGLEKIRTAEGQDGPEVAQALGQMGLLRADEGKYKEAESLVGQALQMAARDSNSNDLAVLKVKAAAGEVWVQDHSYQKAIAMLEPIVKLAPASEEGALLQLESLTALEVAEEGLGHYDRALVLGQQLVETDRRIYGNSHPRLAYDYANLGAVEASTGHLPEAERLYRKSVGIFKAWYPETQPDYLAAKSILATVLGQENKLDEATALLKSVLPLQEQVFGTQHPYVSFTLNSLGKLAVKRHDYDAAEGYLKRSFEVSQALYGAKDFNTAVTESDLADVYLEKGEYLRAEPLLDGAAVIVNSRPMPRNMSVGVVNVKYGHVLVELKRYKEAEKPLITGYKILMSRKPPLYARQLERARRDLTTVYKALGKPQASAEFSGS
jgi:serine/threonine-protein kinase